MSRYFVVLMGLALVAGCSSDKMSQAPSRDDQARLAAYAARTELPANAQGSNDLQAAAIVNMNDKTLTIRNFSDQNLVNANVWVNGDYVRQVDTIPAHGSTTISLAQFYNKQGMSLSGQNVTVQRVQVQSGNQLFNLQGPQMQ